jgi:SEC-C motif domain protein
MSQSTDMSNDSCPCGSSESYAACCGRFLSGAALPETAEQLMRSRYAAYVCADAGYLLATWHSRTRPAQLNLDDRVKWLGLKVRSVHAGGPEDDTGTVSFVARHKLGGRAHRLDETSRFVREQGRWVYLDGDVGE